MTTPPTPTITAELTGQPPVLRLSQTDVPSSIWYEVELILEGSVRQGAGDLHVPPVSLLQNRRRLLDLLIDGSVALHADERIRDILTRANNDDRAFTRALSDADLDTEIDVAEACAAGPVAVTRTLRDFQTRDLAKLARLEHGANFSVPGAGKTTVAYALHAILRARQTVDKLLVIAPLSAFSAWEDDALQVLDPAPRVARMNSTTVPNSPVVLLNYQRLPQSVDQLAAWMLRHRVHLVIDEAHRAKRGVAGEWGRALATLAPLATRRDILTGTPAPNHPKDFVALFDFLWPSRRASARIPSNALATNPVPSAVRAVGEAIRPFFVRTNKATLDLPPVNIVETPVEMEPLQRDIYELLKNRYAGTLSVSTTEAADFARMGEVVMYLLQAASSPRLLRNATDPARAYRYPPLAIPAGSRLAQLIEQYADYEMPAKLSAACQLVAQNADEGKKTLVWSNFPENLEDMRIQLAALEPAVVHGGVPSVDEDLAGEGQVTREREIYRFRNDPACKVLLANPAAMSEGISLHLECHDAIYIDRTFNAGQYLQSLDRIHRLGLAPDVVTNVTILTSPNTIDDSVNRRVEIKAKRLGDMLADENLVRMALPDDEDGVVFLDDRDDMEALFRHLATPPPAADPTD